MPGSFFDVGTTLVTCTATDECGNEKTCTFNVTVLDTEPPVALCQNTTIFLSENGGRSIDVDRIDGGSSDNCDIVSRELSKTSFDCSNLGENTVTLTVTDASGNVSSCESIVTVRDARPPTLVCPADTVRSPNESCLYTPPDGGGASLLGSPTVSDNCTAVEDIVVTNNAPGSFVIGTTAVVWTAIDDSGNSVSCTQLVTVSTDDTPPTIICPLDTVRSADEDCAYTPPDGGGASLLGEATASDNCSDEDDIVVTNDAPASFEPGVHEVVWTATDEEGNSAQCTQIVTVVDDKAPTLTCPGSVSRNPNDGNQFTPGSGEASLGDPTVSDNCTATEDIVVSSDAPSSFPLGTTTVTYTATDEAGNVSTCTQMVTVVDAVAPEITCPAPLTVEPNAGGGWVGDFGAATATDSDSDDATIVITNNAPGSFPVGTTVVLWTATDSAGNSSMCPQEITVVDTTPPTITCPGDDISTECTDANGTVVEFTASAVDNTGDENATVACEPPSGSVFPPGVTTVVCTATDLSGNTVTCEFTVEVLCGGFVVPGDCNSDGNIDLSDAVCILSILFNGSDRVLSCGDGRITHPASMALLGWNGEGVDLTAAIALLNWKFIGGPPHVLGMECQPVKECDNVCELDL